MRAGEAEFTHLLDTGCKHGGPSCLACQLPMCVHDDREPFSDREDFLLLKVGDADEVHRLLSYRSSELLRRRLHHLRIVEARKPDAFYTPGEAR